MSYFFRQRFHFTSEELRKFDESKVTRGKTTPESNSGSFAPHGTPATVGNAASTFALAGGQVRAFRDTKNVAEADLAVAQSKTPSQTLQAQFSASNPYRRRMTEDEIKQELARRVGESDWARYVAVSQATKQAIKDAGGDTETQHATVTKVDGEKVITYDEQRMAEVQNPVIRDYLSRYVEAAQANATGEAEFVLLAGRGGSGKSSFGYTDGAEGEATGPFFGFYAKGSIVIDPDEVKHKLYEASMKAGIYPKDAAFDPRRNGAGYWHEESSHVTKVIQNKILELADQGFKANVVVDVTLSSNKGDLMGDFRERGFSTTLAGMNIPPEDSAYQAVNRFLTGNQGTGGRLVPVEVIANSVKNEVNFDTMINMKTASGLPVVGSWSLFTLADRGPPHHVATGGKRVGKGEWRGN